MVIVGAGVPEATIELWKHMGYSEEGTDVWLHLLCW